MQAAIAAIADVGYANTSYARIAREAGLSSTGLISYHFDSKDELTEQVIAEVVTSGQRFMMPKVQKAVGARARLRAYLESNLEFMAAYPAHIAAVASILAALPRDRDGQPAAYAELHERGVTQLVELLRDGQRAGELRRFDPRVMAVTIRAAVDSAAYQLAAGVDLDLRRYARELCRLFDLGTRSDTGLG